MKAPTLFRCLVVIRLAVHWRSLALAVSSTVILSACGPSSPTTPTPPAPTTPSPSLTIVGTTVLLTGVTSQLVVKDESGNLVTGVQWQSQSPEIVTVSSTGLVTANAIGTTVVTAAAAGLTATASVIVQPTNSTMVTLKACDTINAPGRYVVDRDLSGAPCLTVTNVAGVDIDCAGHATGPIVLTNVSSASVTNCDVTRGNIRLIAVTSVTVTQSIVHNGSIWATSGTGLVIRSNSFSEGGCLSSCILLDNGSNNLVSSNTMYGGYLGGLASSGIDDGIILDNETGDTIEQNTIGRFYDAGIEGTNSVAHTTIANNTISNVGAAAISSYWCTAWTGNVVRGNQVSSTPQLLFVLYDSTPPHCRLPVTPAAFSDNQFIDNVFRNPVQGRRTTSSDLARMSVDMHSGLVDNNLIQGNDFGQSAGPNLIPLAGFVDGGGNICGPFNANLSNFRCSAGARGLFPAGR